MDSHSRSASPREQPRPQQRPPSPPSPRLPPAAFDNKAYQHDDADPNHNESFTSNGAQQNGHNKELNGDSKSVEAVNLELINLTPKNGSLKQKKDVEVDMNGSNPYDEYFVPVNEHRKYMRGEKLYVTADKRGEKGGCKRPLCWTLLTLVVAAIIALIALAATGVIFSNSPTPVDPYNVTISSARALNGIGQSHDEHVHDHDHDQHDHNHDQTQEPHDHNNDQNQEEQHHNNDQSQNPLDQNQEQVHDLDQNEQSTEQNQEQPGHIHEQENNEHNQDDNQQLDQKDLDHEHKEVMLDQTSEHDQNQGQPEHSLDQDHKQHDQGQDQDMMRDNEQLEHGENLDQNDQSNQQHNPEVHMPDTQNDEGQHHAVVPVVNDVSMYVPRTVEGELKIDNAEFLETYNDPESNDYRQFTDDFKAALMRALFDQNTVEAGDNDINIEVIQLRPGSVVVKYRINWRPKNEMKPTQDLFNATTLEEKLNNYLINNNRMISTYHVAGDNFITKPVLDLCQINKNDCQDGCEFDETSLDFICTCSQGLILDMHDLKTCVPYLPHPESKPIQEISDEANQPAYTTTTTTPVNPPVIDYSSRVNWKGIEAETTTEAETDQGFSSAYETLDKNKWDVESTIEHNQPNKGIELVTRPSPDTKVSVITQSEDYLHPVSEFNSTVSPIDVPNTTNYVKHLNDVSVSDSHEEKEESIDLTTKPEVYQEDKEENVMGQHELSPIEVNITNVTETKTDMKPSQYETSSSSYDSESKGKEGNYADAAFNLDEALGSHQIITPEEIYTEQPESATNEENESKEMSHSIIETEPNVMSESNETLVSSEIANSSIKPHESMEVLFDKDIKTSSPTTTTGIPTTVTNLHQDFKEIMDQSHDTNLEEISHEKDVITGSSDTSFIADNSKGEINVDDTDDWLSDTLPADNKTDKTSSTVDSSGPDTLFLNENLTKSENNLESRSFNNFTNDSGVTTMSNKNSSDMSSLLNGLSVDNNTTKNDTEQYNSTAVGAMDETEINKSVLNKENSISEKNNNTNFDYDKKQKDYDIMSITRESKQQNPDDINSNEEITTEVSENSSEIINHMPQDILKAMDSLNEPQINETLTNSNISDSGKYVTFDDINMLLNRSSKSMENLTDNKEVIETTSDKTVEITNSPLKQNDSEWLSESVTEVKYNDGVNTMDKTETTESIKNKVDHIMAHVKDDYEPDYLSKADDSVYMMERDYDSEDPRVKRVNMENKDVIITEDPKEKNTETNSTSNAAFTTSEPFSAQTIVINVATSTTSAPSTTISDFIYNTADKNINNFSEASEEIATLHNTSPIPLLQEPATMSKDFNNESRSDTIQTASKEIIEPLQMTTSTTFAPHTYNNDTLDLEASDNNKLNETQISNLDVTIYEISHPTGNHSMPISKSTNTHMSEYEDHETEMNPFLPEAENNKNLVKKLQEGHDFELTNMNETQNDNSDEHHFNNTEGRIINNNNGNDTPTTQYVKNQMTIMTTTENKPLFEIQTDDSTNIKNTVTSESSDSNKIVQEDKDKNVEVLPISTFLIDTDDLEANKISSSTKSFKDNLSRYKSTNNENLSVVPITQDIENENSNTQSRDELNDISDSFQNSEKRTLELNNYGPFTNNES